MGRKESGNRQASMDITGSLSDHNKNAIGPWEMAGIPEHCMVALHMPTETVLWSIGEAG